MFPASSLNCSQVESGLQESQAESESRAGPESQAESESRAGPEL